MLRTPDTQVGRQPDCLAVPSGDLYEAEESLAARGGWNAIMVPAAALGRTAVKVGDRAPDFEALDQHGNTLALRDLLDSGPVVVYFYSKAMTPG